MLLYCKYPLIYFELFLFLSLPSSLPLTHILGYVVHVGMCCGFLSTLTCADVGLLQQITASSLVSAESSFNWVDFFCVANTLLCRFVLMYTKF